MKENGYRLPDFLHIKYCNKNSVTIIVDLYVNAVFKLILAECQIEFIGIGEFCEITGSLIKHLKMFGSSFSY